MTPILTAPLSATDVTPIGETLPTAETDCGKAELIGSKCECYEYLGATLINTDTSDAGGLYECKKHCNDNCTPVTSYTGGYESDSGGGGGCFIGILFSK